MMQHHGIHILETGESFVFAGDSRPWNVMGLKPEDQPPGEVTELSVFPGDFVAFGTSLKEAIDNLAKTAKAHLKHDPEWYDKHFFSNSLEAGPDGTAPR